MAGLTNSLELIDGLRFVPRLCHEILHVHIGMIQLGFEENIERLRSIVSIMVLKHEKSGFICVRECHKGVSQVDISALSNQLADLLGFLGLYQALGHFSFDVGCLRVVKFVGASIGTALDLLEFLIQQGFFPLALADRERRLEVLEDAGNFAVLLSRQFARVQRRQFSRVRQ